MTNVDFRVQNIISSKQFQNIRADHISRDIKPVLEKVKKELEQAGIEAPVEIMIKDGDPVTSIAQTANERNFSTLVLQRRDLSKVEELFVGSVSSGILHREFNGSIYLTPGKISTIDNLPKRFLIALDESKNSQATLEEAAILISGCAETIEKVVLIHILDIAECTEALAGGKVPKDPPDDLLDKAAVLIKEQGLAEGKIMQISCCGDPADTLVQEVKTQEIHIIFMGRRDRTALKELFMGSVSRKIIHYCGNQTIVLANATD
jgi:nucleotide-binding universal stress UspA family protein